jgi:gliding motility-associated-like protein
LNLTINNTTTSTTNITRCSNQLPYNWNGTNYNAAGSYDVTLTNYNGCDSTATLILTINATSTTNLNAAICQGTSFTLPWGGLVNTAGTYSHTYSTISGCDSIVNINLTINPVYNNNVQAVTCQGTPYNLPWGGTATTAGTYSNTYTTVAGCDSVVNILLTIVNTTQSTNNMTICSSQLPYAWNGQILNSQGTYTITITGSNGCDSIVTLQLSVNLTPSAPQTAETFNFCQGQIIGPITAIGTYPLLWYTTSSGGTGSPNAPVPSTVNPGIYHFYVSQINGSCEGPRAHIVVRINRKPILGADKNLRICFGDSVNLMNQFYTTGYNYQWIWNNQQVANPYSVYAAGNYQLVVSNTSGCKDTAQVNVNVQPIVVANAGPDDNAVYNQPYQLNGSGGLYYQWQPASLLNNPLVPNPIVVPNQDLQFILTVSDDFGCNDKDTVNIRVLNGPTFYIPNAFTPDGDGLNDNFKPTYVGIEKPSYFRIFDRYGVLVFETADLNGAWNGFFKSTRQPIGNYVYIVKGTDKFGNEKVLKGNVLLLR